MLIVIAGLYGAGCVSLLFIGAREPHPVNIITLSLASLVAIPFIAALFMIIRNPVVGVIDDAGIHMTFWKTGPIPWEEIDSYGIRNPGEGGPVVAIYLHNEKHYLSAASFRTRMVGPLRRWIFGTSFVIYAGNVDRKLPDIEATLQNRIQGRVSVA